MVGEGTRRAGSAKAAEEAVVERGAGFAAVLLLLLLLLTGEVILNGLGLRRTLSGKSQ